MTIMRTTVEPRILKTIPLNIFSSGAKTGIVDKERVGQHVILSFPIITFLIMIRDRLTWVMEFLQLWFTSGLPGWSIGWSRCSTSWKYVLSVHPFYVHFGGCWVSRRTFDRDCCWNSTVHLVFVTSLIGRVGHVRGGDGCCCCCWPCSGRALQIVHCCCYQIWCWGWMILSVRYVLSLFCQWKGSVKYCGLMSREGLNLATINEYIYNSIRS